MPKDVLVVDDEVQITKALKALFEQKGFRVHTAATAHDALAQFRKHPAEIVLLDLKLPDGWGLDVLTRLKKIAPSARVVVISGFGDPATVQEAFQLGASDFLAKPFDFDTCFHAAMGIEVAKATEVRPEPEALARVTVSMAHQYQVLPVRCKDDLLVLMMSDPLDVQRLDELKMVLGCEIQPVAAVGGSIAEAIQRCYGVGAGVSSAAAQDRPAAVVSFPATGMPATGFEEATGIVRLVNEVIKHASTARATDLHLGIDAEGCWIRERIDGVLYNVPVADQFSKLYSGVVSRIKVMAGLDIAEHRVPQDGRILFEEGATRLDMRVSVMPSIRGEGLAIRLLEPSLSFQIGKLGLDDAQLKSVKTMLAKPSGLFLVTGPTGSGKSTSLYAFLTMLSARRVNIITIEDPVEHEMPGVTQIQVQPKVGLTFANGLRSMLRHDPDIMMVGEIRDQETASLAVRAALTGHLVLSTLHTNDASSGITRLLDLGVEPFLLCSTLAGILSQRLLRLLCESCRASVVMDVASLGPMGVAVPPGHSGAVKVPLAKGCQKCRRTGYHGRTGAFEVLTIDHHVRSLLIKGSSSVQIRQSAISKGMVTLAQASWQKVRDGVTSLEEIVRVLPQDLR